MTGEGSRGAGAGGTAVLAPLGTLPAAAPGSILPGVVFDPRTPLAPQAHGIGVVPPAAFRGYEGRGGGPGALAGAGGGVASGGFTASFTKHTPPHVTAVKLDETREEKRIREAAGSVKTDPGGSPLQQFDPSSDPTKTVSLRSQLGRGGPLSAATGARASSSIGEDAKERAEAAGIQREKWEDHGKAAQSIGAGDPMQRLAADPAAFPQLKQSPKDAAKQPLLPGAAAGGAAPPQMPSVPGPGGGSAGGGGSQPHRDATGPDPDRGLVIAGDDGSVADASSAASRPSSSGGGSSASASPTAIGGGARPSQRWPAPTRSSGGASFVGGGASEESSGGGSTADGDAGVSSPDAGAQAEAVSGGGSEAQPSGVWQFDGRTSGSRSSPLPTRPSSARNVAAAPRERSHGGASDHGAPREIMDVGGFRPTTADTLVRSPRDGSTAHVQGAVLSPGGSAAHSGFDATSGMGIVRPRDRAHSPAGASPPEPFQRWHGPAATRRPPQPRLTPRGPSRLSTVPNASARPGPGDAPGMRPRPSLSDLTSAPAAVSLLRAPRRGRASPIIAPTQERPPLLFDASQGLFVSRPMARPSAVHPHASADARLLRPADTVAPQPLRSPGVPSPLQLAQAGVVSAPDGASFTGDSSGAIEPLESERPAPGHAPGTPPDRPADLMAPPRPLGMDEAFRGSGRTDPLSQRFKWMASAWDEAGGRPGGQSLLSDLRTGFRWNGPKLPPITEAGQRGEVTLRLRDEMRTMRRQFLDAVKGLGLGATRGAVRDFKQRLAASIYADQMAAWRADGRRPPKPRRNDTEKWVDEFFDTMMQMLPEDPPPPPPGGSDGAPPADGDDDGARGGGSGSGFCPCPCKPPEREIGSNLDGLDDGYVEPEESIVPPTRGDLLSHYRGGGPAPPPLVPPTTSITASAVWGDTGACQLADPRYRGEEIVIGPGGGGLPPIHATPDDEADRARAILGRREQTDLPPELEAVLEEIFLEELEKLLAELGLTLEDLPPEVLVSLFMQLLPLIVLLINNDAVIADLKERAGTPPGLDIDGAIGLDIAEMLDRAYGVEFKGQVLMALDQMRSNRKGGGSTAVTEAQGPFWQKWDAAQPRRRAVETGIKRDMVKLLVDAARHEQRHDAMLGPRPIRQSKLHGYFTMLGALPAVRGYMHAARHGMKLWSVHAPRSATDAFMDGTPREWGPQLAHALDGLDSALFEDSWSSQLYWTWRKDYGWSTSGLLKMGAEAFATTFLIGASMAINPTTLVAGIGVRLGALGARLAASGGRLAASGNRLAKFGAALERAALKPVRIGASVREGKSGAEAAVSQAGIGERVGKFFNVFPNAADPARRAELIARAIARGKSAAEARALAAPLGKSAMGEHWIPRAKLDKWIMQLVDRGNYRAASALTKFRDSPFNVLKPSGISRGEFEELHFLVDPSRHGGNFGPKSAFRYSGAREGLTKYGLLGRSWYGTPTPTKLVIGGGTSAIGIGSNEMLGPGDE